MYAHNEIVFVVLDSSNLEASILCSLDCLQHLIFLFRQTLSQITTPLDLRHSQHHL